jgi:putative transposase
VRTAARRAAVRWLRDRFAFSERRACRVVGMGRSTLRYRPRPRADEEVLRERLRQVASERRRFGYRRLHALLRREGVRVNHKRIELLYREEGLAVRRRGRKRIVVAGRGRLPALMRPNEQWGVDFLSDALVGGRRIRLFTVLDLFTRETLAIEIDTSLPGERVVRVLERVVASRGFPQCLVLDNGPELTGLAMDRWATASGVQLRFIDPGKPIQDAIVESFHDRLRDKCRNEHWFVSLGDAGQIVEGWRLDYNR